jgi:tripartite-type tricarboxylate transporter receptor subunit TctC
VRQLSRFMLGLFALLAAGTAIAQSNYPEKVIHIIVGLQPGTAMDMVARLLAQRLAESLGKPVLVENVPGAAGNIGTGRVAKAAPDGYTLILAGSGQITVNPSLYKLSFDPVKDLAPISQIADYPYLLVVHNAVPAKSALELVALAKAKRGELTYAAGGTGPFLTAESFKAAAGIDVREIRYKAVMEAVPDLIGGRITMMFSPISNVLPLVREGKVRALGVTSLRRSAPLPNVPTIDESGFPGFESTQWYGLFAPDKTPAAIVRKLHLETVNALAREEVRAKLAEQGLGIIGNSPDEFAALIRSEGPRWAKLIRDSSLKAD